VWYPDFLIRMGHLEAAQELLERGILSLEEEGNLQRVALFQVVWGILLAPTAIETSRKYLAAGRAYATRSGHIEITLRCYHLAATLARCERESALGVTEAMNGVQLADSCGFGRWSIDIRLELAQVYLANGQAQLAIEPAEKALAMSEDPECQYAWGIADGLHLLGVAHARLGEKTKARDCLQRAVEKRGPLQHPELKESKEELQRVIL
jgi:hypothetical protein